MATDTSISFLQRFGQQRRIAAYLLFSTIFLISLYDRSDISIFSVKAVFFVLLMLSMPYTEYQLANYLQIRFRQRQNTPIHLAFTFYDEGKNINIIWPIVFIDAICVGMSISYLHYSLIPTLVFLATLVVRLIELDSMLFAAFSILLCLLSAYVTAYFIWQQDRGLTLHTITLPMTSALLSVASIVGFSLYISIALSYSEKHVSLLKKNLLASEQKNHLYIKMADRIARYAPSQIWHSIVNGTFESRIGNKRKKLTIFFSDIEGFTELSEQLSPDDLAALLNTYFEKMANIAQKYGGTIDKFMGDALVVFFGDPTTAGTKNDAIACINMAIAMQSEMRRLRQTCKTSDMGQLHVRMGITTGYCHVGNFGNVSRMSYTIIGREANLAARLQCSAVCDEILITDETYKLVRSQVGCIERGKLQLRGIAQPIQTWQVVGRYEDLPAHQQRWSEYELDGFNLQLDMDMIKADDKLRIKQALQQAVDHLDRPKPLQE